MNHFKVMPYCPEDPAPEPSNSFTMIANRIMDLTEDMGGKWLKTLSDGTEDKVSVSAAATWMVYVQLLRFVDWETGFCKPGIDKLAKRSHLHKETVILAIERLVQLDLVKVEKIKGKVNHYWVIHRN